ncbi:hypothetical protein NHH03_24085 [Stieleria sp. TO1_6]|nr:hypothetical protein [Stieleria tagensis]MCO8124839.1 hypothetical protein [Stieleria tagensis]
MAENSGETVQSGFPASDVSPGWLNHRDADDTSGHTPERTLCETLRTG